MVLNFLIMRLLGAPQGLKREAAALAQLDEVAWQRLRSVYLAARCASLPVLSCSASKRCDFLLSAYGRGVSFFYQA